MKKKNSEPSWSSYYEDCRREMEFRYGLKRIPRDRYKEQFALGATVQQAASAIYKERECRGL